jgi:hypothetical protein
MSSVENNVGEGTIDLQKSIINQKSNTLVLITNNPPEMKYFTPIIYQNALFGSYLPSPVHLFFEQAIEHARTIEELIKLFPKHVEQTLNNNSKGEFKIINSDLYNSYLIYKISAITSLIMTIECFVNTMIPEDYSYKEKEGKALSKPDIERYITLKQKLKNLIPEIVSIGDVQKYRKLCDKIIEINLLRNEFIHLKTAKTSNNADPFIDHFETLVNLNLKLKIEETKELINLITPNYL